MYFDTHAHYDDREQLLASMPENGVTLIVNAGSNMESSRMALKLAAKFPFVYAAAGVHPHDAKEMDDNTILELEKLFADPKAVAVGEIGLDYHYDFSPRDVQQKRFREQMELARSLKLPAVIHEREAAGDVLSIVREFSDVRGVYHCYSGSWETAKIVLNQGWYLSFTGVITFKNARRVAEVIQQMPEDRIMIETDCPYLAPEPNRGKRNSSLNLVHIAQRIAEIRGITLQEAAQITMENGKRFFGIDA